MSRKTASRPSSSKKMPAPPTIRTHEPTHDEIATRAFEFYCARGGMGGDALADWLRAECELRSAMA